MDLVLNRLRQGVKATLQQFGNGVWLDELGLAWERVQLGPRVQFETACLQAGFADPVALVKSFPFCHIVTQPEAHHRPIVKYDDPIPKLDRLAQQLRLDICSRYEHVAASDVVFELCQQFKVPSLDHFCLKVSSISTLQQLTDLNAKVSDFAAAYVGARWVMHVTSFHSSCDQTNHETSAGKSAPYMTWNGNCANICMYLSSIS